MQLTFNKKTSQFILSTTSPPALEWVKIDSKSYATPDIQAAARFRRYADTIAEKVLSRAFVKQYPLPSRRLPSFLDTHQVDGVSWLLSRSRSYLAHAPGAGKTLEAVIGALWSVGVGQTVFIVPPSLTLNWAREIMKFTGMLTPKTLSEVWPSISIVPESNHQESMGWNADFIIVPDSMLTKPWVLTRLIAMKKKFIAVDEASRFKESTSARTVALFGGRTKNFYSPGLIQEATHAVLLDGSPMPNRPMELWAPTIAMCPESLDFMSQQDFGFRYCGATLNKFGAWEFKRASNEQELRHRLQKYFMHVVTEESLGHSARLRSLVFMNQDPRTAEYKRWERKLLGRMPISDVIKESGRGEITVRRRELGESKTPWAASYISERLDSGESVLVFAWHREVCTDLQQRLSRFKPGLIIGGTHPERREEFLREFQSKKRRLLILNIVAGGRGHNIQSADRIIFVEPSWSDEVNKQCEKRASRRGRDAALGVKCDYLVIPNSIDEMVMNSIFGKEKTVKRVIG